MSALLPPWLSSTLTTSDAAAGMDLRRAARIGALGALVMTFVSAIGMVESFDRRALIVPVLTLGAAVFYGVPFVVGAIAAGVPDRPGRPTREPGAVDLVSSVVAGLVASLGPAIVLLGLRSDLDLRRTFPSLSPALRSFLEGDRPGATAYLVLGVTVGAVALVGGCLRLVPRQPQRALVLALEVVLALSMVELIFRQILGNVGLSSLHRTLYVTNSGLRLVPALALFVLITLLATRFAGRRASTRERMLDLDAAPERSRRRSVVVFAVLAVVLAVTPMLVGSIVNELLVNVGLFMLMALGLNIIVGYAGLLDLGHVTFFAIGSYAMAVLTSPGSPGFAPELTWFVALPIVIVLAAVGGVFVGTPVIRLRGDYLAIVTLGFAAILERLFISDWLRPYFGGAQGIRRIPGVELGGLEIRGTDPRAMLYITLVFVLVAVYVSWSLQNSRLGRAWAALREDETTAQAMGVDTTKTKLMAFVIGAMISSTAGALFAAKVGTVFPNSFQLLVSIVILVVVIVGGMGHFPGVLVGAVVLIGVLGGPRLPGLLQEFEDYKMLVYGALLVYMMLQRPEGLVPSVRRTRELHQEEMLQDAWLEKKGRFVDGEPATAGASDGAAGSAAEGSEPR